MILIKYIKSNILPQCRDQLIGIEETYPHHHINPFATGNTPVCGWRLEHADNIGIYAVSRNHFLGNYSSKISHD